MIELQAGDLVNWKKECKQLESDIRDHLRQLGKIEEQLKTAVLKCDEKEAEVSESKD